MSLICIQLSYLISMIIIQPFKYSNSGNRLNIICESIFLLALMALLILVEDNLDFEVR